MKAVVLNNHTLGLLWEDTNILEVLKSLISEGAPIRISEDPICLDESSKTRPATLKDFKKFRVQHHPSYEIA